ncbi:biopolymer transporter ExbD [Sorangium sp. So ce291]|uniref:biopolymer transporter ExbD n=1 Tax=Sorangium sp. So ce291 TaxID=3133294 RepID=UPI003F62BDE1
MRASSFRSSALPRLALLVGSILAAPACESAPKPPEPGAAATAASVAEAPAEPPKLKGMPELLVDSMGPYLGGQRVDLAQKEGPEKLAKAIRALPIEGKPVTLIADKKAKPSAVAAVVTELGAAGAPQVIIKTDGRDDLPKEITVVPEGRVSKPPACAVSTMVMKDLATAIWPFGGGMGKRQRKGLAGPDLSNTGEQLTKDIAACSASVAFFSADDEVPWEMAHNLAGTVIASDAKKKLNTLVLLRAAPVAGRPVQLGGG